MLVSKSRSLCARDSCPFDVSTTKAASARMTQFFSPPSARFRRKVGRFFLAFCWVGGLMCGMWFCSAAGMPLLLRMHPGFPGPVSIRCMLCTTLLPFLLCAIAVCGSCSAFLYVLAFAKGFSIACVGLAIQAGWGEAGWLMRWLLTFSSLLSAPLLYGFLLRHVGRSGGLTFSRAAWLFSAAAVLASAHSFIIAPMLVRLIYS